MTHDKFCASHVCDMFRCTKDCCNCKNIAKIRADERARFVAAFAKHFSASCDHWTVEECREYVASTLEDDEK